MAESLYLHVPFCKSICHYCDFKRTLYKEEVAQKWLIKIKEELKNKNINASLKMIYVGGGTPTSLSDSQLYELLSLLKPYSLNVSEYTFESNIESLSLEKIKMLKEFGVNRISLGVQSLQDHLLVYMNRKHKKIDVFSKIEEIYEQGIENISVDFIYGLQAQTLDMWKEDLHTICKNSKVSHISLYSLTIEENSVFGKRKVELIENELEAEMYKQAILILKEYGFNQYEIANFARDGKESLHNKTYWNYDDFYGIGLGASGKEENIRYENTGTLMDYINGKHQVVIEELEMKDLIFENIMMSLRMRKGIDLELFKQRYHKDLYCMYKDVIDAEIREGNMVLKDTFLFTTQKGMFYLHDILVRFMED